MLSKANPGRDLPRLGTVFALLLSVTLPALGNLTAKRELALKHFQQAVSQRLEIETVPEDQRTPALYQKVIDAFRRVYLTTPRSSKADDSLFAVGEIFLQMAQRFGPVPYRDKAVEAYQFLMKEYPYSPLSREARKKLEELGLPAAGQEVETAAAESRPGGRLRPGGAAPQSPDEPAAGQALATEVETAAAATPLLPKKGLPLVTAVRHWSSPGMTRIVIEVEADVKPSGARLTNPDRVYLDLPETRLAPEIKGKTLPVGDDLVKQIRLAQTQIGVTRVVLDLNADAEHSFSSLTNPSRVVVDLKKAGTAPSASQAAASKPEVTLVATPSPLAPPKAAAPTSRGERNLIRALGLKIGRVVIDAGHGGHDTGTIGPTGLFEKDLTLDVATRLGALISDRIGGEVIYTRAEDVFIPLEDRTALANEKQADLFISIHANSSSLKAVRGIETYYLNLTANREAMEVAARENAASQKSIHELQDLVSKIALTEKISESREFASQVQRALFATASRENKTLRDRGIRKAPFVVLIGARMPSVLAEISFLSNPRDEKLLKTPAYRQKLAEALYNGVAGYVRSLSRVEVAAR